MPNSYKKISNTNIVIRPTINKNSNKGIYFHEPVNISRNANMEIYFPKTKNMNKLMITNVGIYSISKPDDADWITSKIIDNIKDYKKLIITDATASVGGNTISFAKQFKKVNAIEMSQIHYEILKNNVNVYGLKNVDIIHGDSLEELPKLKQNIIFIDAPWGGSGYKKLKFARLYMSGTPLPIIVNNLINRTEYVVLKVPKNFDYTYFFQKVIINKFTIYKNRRFHLIFMDFSDK